MDGDGGGDGVQIEAASGAVGGETSEEPGVPAESVPGMAAAAEAGGSAEPADANSTDEFDLSSPELYLNRELTWLSFNWRVLHEVEDDRVPLLERVKFLAIVNSNLDEFIMKRIGGLKQQVGAGLHGRTVDGRTPREQIAESMQVVAELELRSSELLIELREELNAAGIFVARVKDLDPAEQKALREYYLENVYPLVTPQAMDPAHPFPFVSNLSLNLLISLRHPKDDNPLLARVKVPVGLGIPRLLNVSGDHVFVCLEDVMAENLDVLFPGMEIDSSELFRVTRNAITESDEDEADDLLALIQSELRERKFAPIVRLQVGSGMVDEHRGMLAAELGLDEHADVVEVQGMLGMSDLMEIAAIDVPELHDEPHRAVNVPELATESNIFHAIRKHGSILLHHPYQSFSTSVERFLAEAATDPKVYAIKMTLYRTSEATQVIDALINAARNGKQVAVVVELKARFDESANIAWASRLEEVGIHVTYGVVGLKTHCKIILALRRDYNGLRRYAHIGTGNYHAGTARLYTDLGLLTADREVGEDLTELFNYLTTGYKPRRKYKKLLTAPVGLKPALLEKIEREIGHARAGRDARIVLKLNALEDADTTRGLYEAAREGVKIDMIVRDTCRLRPGLPGLTENVRVISIVGRFLEHARIVYFQNDGSPEYYIGSADWMKRNLESRVESLVPVELPAQQQELQSIIDAQLEDPRSAWDMQSDGTYVQRSGGEGRQGRNAQSGFARRAEKQLKQAQKLRKRKTKSPVRGPSR
jgi:polyphosphate kinase